MNEETASKLKICSFNVNSVGKNPKRRQMFHFLKKKKADIYVLVDTRIDKKIENSIKIEWGGEIVFNSYSSRARGIAILFDKNLDIKVNEISRDNEGNMLALELEYNMKNILLIGLYGPNRDDPLFMKIKFSKR